MKVFLSTVILLFIYVSLATAQIDKLLSIKDKLEKKISVGSSTDEVKKIIGKPDAIEGGFPNSNSTIISDLPEQVGQLNSSTWFYFLPKRKVTYDLPEDGLCYLNGIQVSIDVYNEYIAQDSIYLHEGIPVPYSMAEGYKVLKGYNSKRLP